MLPPLNSAFVMDIGPDFNDFAERERERERERE
jgi:hypothetical protein